jgi:hypothetical protein
MARQLSNFTCCVCSATVRAMGGGLFTRCDSCKAAGKFVPRQRYRAGVLSGKSLAGAAVTAAVRDGSLQHPSNFACADCRRPAQQYDHRDYNKPLQVVAVCRRCNLLRGPAIPLIGSIEQVVDHGRVPYVNRCSVAKLFRTMGLPVERLAAMPRRLEITHWRELVPLFAAGPNNHKER